MSNIFETIIGIGLSTVVSIGAFIMKHIFNRLDALESKLDHTVTEQEVRTILSDKLDPMKEDIQEIKQAMIKIYELYLKGEK
jgi:uncharacterized membrane protein YgaE (UPF0421/DUF939 family)